MSKSIWYIFIFGILGVLLLTMAMCMSFDMQSDTDLGSRRKLGNAVCKEFRFVSAEVELKQEGTRKLMRVKYTTRPEAPLVDFQVNSEMLKVAAFARHRYEGTDKRYIAQVLVTRTEMRTGEGGEESAVTERLFTNPKTPLSDSMDPAPPDREP